MLDRVKLLSVLHILNDGYQASFLLLLPFIAKDLNINLTQIGTLGTFLYGFEIIFESKPKIKILKGAMCLIWKKACDQ